MKIVAIQTKSMGWLRGFHEVEKWKWLEFSLGDIDKQVYVSAISINHLVDGGMASTLDYLYPIDDVINYIVSNQKDNQ